MSELTLVLSILAIGITSLLSIIAWAFHTGNTHNAVKGLEVRMDRMESKVDRLVEKLVDKT